VHVWTCSAVFLHICQGIHALILFNTQTQEQPYRGMMGWKQQCAIISTSCTISSLVTATHLWQMHSIEWHTEALSSGILSMY
jgi:hypothetical protein